jgi:hypothetical protein
VRLDADAAPRLDPAGLGKGLAGHHPRRNQHGIARDAALVRDHGRDMFPAFDVQHLLRSQDPHPATVQLNLSKASDGFFFDQGNVPLKWL